MARLNCIFCDISHNRNEPDPPGWQYKGKYVHLSCYLEFQNFIAKFSLRDREVAE